MLVPPESLSPTPTSLLSFMSISLQLSIGQVPVHVPPKPHTLNIPNLPQCYSYIFVYIWEPDRMLHGMAFHPSVK